MVQEQSILVQKAVASDDIAGSYGQPHLWAALEVPSVRSAPQRVQPDDLSKREDILNFRQFEKQLSDSWKEKHSAED